MSESEYVTNESWVQQAGRPDLIDEVADQFERPLAPAATGSQAFWSEAEAVPWPRASRGWRSRELMAHRTVERRAG